MFGRKLFLIIMGLMCVGVNASVEVTSNPTQQWAPALPRRSKTAPPIITSEPTIEGNRDVGGLTHNCSLCTKEQCASPSKMLECLSFCSSDLKDCMKATPSIKDSNDANKYGNIQYQKLMKKLYEIYPLSEYWLNERSKVKSDPISADEKQQLDSALKEIGKQCSTIVKKIETSINANVRTKYSKKSKEMLREFKEIERDLLSQPSVIINNMSKNLNNVLASDRKNIKKSVSEVLLLAKNCFNQGEGAAFSAKEDSKKNFSEFLKRKIMPKK